MNTENKEIKERFKTFLVQHYDGPSGYLTLQGHFEGFLAQELTTARKEERKKLASYIQQIKDYYEPPYPENDAKLLGLVNSILESIINQLN